MNRLTREQSRDLTQQKLRQAALSEFAANGFAGASIDRIAETAGFSRGAFYANYKGKHEILLELLRELSEREVGRWRLLVEEHAGQADFFQVIADRFAALIDETLWGLFAVEVRLQARRDAQFACEYQHYLSGISRSIGELIAVNFEKAGKRPPADLEQMTHAFHSLALGLVLSMDGSRTRDARAAGLIVAHFLQGLLLLPAGESP
ncbi:TPA: TetR/AcrR family transcriptional regulator [Pseudomonas aeruginosa]